ncbi:hypothetical protein TNCV_1174831 [Trichonephila clavipes]|nr:hypothetical protein TNCV_1174831 [Trichonephila clavipes]
MKMMIEYWVANMESLRSTAITSTRPIDKRSGKPAVQVSRKLQHRQREELNRLQLPPNLYNTIWAMELRDITEANIH